MDVSRPEGRTLLLGLGLLFSSGGAAVAQDVPPALAGTVYVGDAPMSAGIVVLHHLSEGTQGELDSLNVTGDGSFSFDLPRAPDPAFGDVFFASVRHQGVLYFGPAITEVSQLDSIYEVLAHDTILAPLDGLPIPLQSRSIFFEPDSAGWRVTDLFQLRNDGDRTAVIRPGGVVWRHLLPAEATDVTTGEGELSFAAADFEEGALVVRAALPPGERLFVVRYHVPEIGIAIPNRGPTEALDVLIREPAPLVEVPGLELLDRIELEEGSTYRRFTGVDVTESEVVIVESEEPGPPPVQWVSLVLAAVLGGAAFIVLRQGARKESPAGSGAVSIAGPGVPRRDDGGRAALLHEVARLDEDFASGARSPAETAAYESRRAELIRRIRAI